MEEFHLGIHKVVAKVREKFYSFGSRTDIKFGVGAMKCALRSKKRIQHQMLFLRLLDIIF